jgi:hypothetical protein
MQENLDYLRRVIRRELRGFARCPNCGHKADVDSWDAFRMIEKGSHCKVCAAPLELSVSPWVKPLS